MRAIGETEFELKKPKHYYDFEAVDGKAIAFGGLYKEWFHPVTGETALSCSIITLPPHEKLSHIHSKAMPLLLRQHDDTMKLWLDKRLTNTEVFNDLLKPNIPQNLLTYPIVKPSLYNPIGEANLIHRDI